MSILETILKGDNGSLLKQLASGAGIDEGLAGAAVAKMLPALTGSIKKNAASESGLDALLGALKRGNHSRYIEDPRAATESGGIADGNAILGHLLGSKDRSRQVAKEAAEATGIDASALKKLLPMIATMAMGTLAKQKSSGGALASARDAKSADRGLLDSFLDKDNDGSMVDDLLGMAKRFL